MSDDNHSTPSEQSIRESLLDAHRSGSLMEAIEETRRTAGIEEEVVVYDLVKLHNDGAIDLIEAFSALRKSEAGFAFFDLRAVLEQALPEIESDVMTVMQCVRHLVHEAGPDLAAGTIIGYFITFLTKESSRPEQALSSIKTKPELQVRLRGSVL